MSRLRSQDAATGGGANLHQLPFDSVMKNSLALNYFYEFLVTINCRRYLDFFLNIEGFRLSAASIYVLICSAVPNKQTGSAGRDAASLRASISEQAASIFAMYFDSAGGGGSAEAAEADGFAARRYGQQEFFVKANRLAIGDQEAEDAASPMEEYEVQYSAKIMRHELIKADGDKHTSYVIHVCKVCDSSHTYEWDVYRRYSEFDELRSALALTFNYSASERYLCARSMLYKFLAPGSLSPGAFASGPGGFGVSGAFGGAAGGATLPAPLRMMRQGSQDIIGRRQAEPAAQGGQARAGLPPLLSASTLGQLPEELRAIGSDLGGSGEVADQENVPLRILLLVMDEIFDVRERNKLIRKGIAAVLSKLVRALLGDRVNRRIVQFARGAHQR
uniref:RGS domain-containing protein n=1 Tax=Macrostomum lignano TaxID=282301 RepID=A0A1I8FG83_9PLAT